MNTGTHILVIRFSAMGDVALSVPVLRELLDQHPQLHITVVTRASFIPFFSGLPRTRVFAAALEGKHQGVYGLFRLFRELSVTRFDALADIHDVLRTRVLRMFFVLSGVRLAVIDKGRAAKKALTRREDKNLRPLKHTSERYADVFRRLGFALTLSHRLQHTGAPVNIPAKKSPDESPLLIGIAPFAKHKGKQYPLEKMGRVIAGLAAENVRISVFGGGADEEKTAAKWASGYVNVESTIGRLALSDELALMARMHLMLTMDSSGMHMASLVGIPVVSVWGATHPFAGFMGYGQSAENALLHPVPCRPCSVFGNKRCWRADAPYACLEGLHPDTIIQKVMAEAQNIAAKRVIPA